MKSILEGREELKAVVYQIAEVTGYLWQKGWAERNGGNITVNVTEYMDDECKAMKAISEVKQIGMVLPQLKGKYFYCKGTGKRMRDLAKEPMQNGSIGPAELSAGDRIMLQGNPAYPSYRAGGHEPYPAFPERR